MKAENGDIVAPGTSGPDKGAIKNHKHSSHMMVAVYRWGTRHCRGPLIPGGGQLSLGRNRHVSDGVTSQDAGINLRLFK